ncbi:hypothetical protein CI238_04414 [Colletotrichum incanum]|uniref:Uncharacterized protein n=1 Tax=Colletotrichum incanum TaxID=1573173 RepID=A0A166VDQ7_COLIC|nr:hypothetical protein CI238_04414 [Colletotrichum incanum]
MILGMIIRLFITPVLTAQRAPSSKKTDRTLGLGFLGPAPMILYGDLIPTAEFIAHLQRMATAWYTDW